LEDEIRLHHHAQRIVDALPSLDEKTVRLLITTLEAIFQDKEENFSTKHTALTIVKLLMETNNSEITNSVQDVLLPTLTLLVKEHKVHQSSQNPDSSSATSFSQFLLQCLKEWNQQYQTNIKSPYNKLSEDLVTLGIQLPQGTQLESESEEEKSNEPGKQEKVKAKQNSSEAKLNTTLQQLSSNVNQTEINVSNTEKISENKEFPSTSKAAGTGFIEALNMDIFKTFGDKLPENMKKELYDTPELENLTIASQAEIKDLHTHKLEDTLTKTNNTKKKLLEKVSDKKADNDGLKTIIAELKDNRESLEKQISLHSESESEEWSIIYNEIDLLDGLLIEYKNYEKTKDYSSFQEKLSEMLG